MGVASRKLRRVSLHPVEREGRAACLQLEDRLGGVSRHPHPRRRDASQRAQARVHRSEGRHVQRFHCPRERQIHARGPRMVPAAQRVDPILKLEPWPCRARERGPSAAGDPPHLRYRKRPGRVAQVHRERVPAYAPEAGAGDMKVRLDIGIRERPCQEQVPLHDSARGVRRLTGTDHAAQVDALQVGARVHAARVEPRGPGDIESAWVHRQRQVRDLESVSRKRGLDRSLAPPFAGSDGDRERIERRESGLSLKAHVAVQRERRVPRCLPEPLDHDLVGYGERGSHVAERPVRGPKPGDRQLRDRRGRRA